MDFRSQIELPTAASSNKEAIRKQEFDQHGNSDLHIQNDGLLDQMLVMTAVGPRLMTPRLRCNCNDSHYSCDCRIVFDDNPPLPAADVVIRCLKNGITPVPDEGTIHNTPAWTLEYDGPGTFFRFVPEKVFNCDLSQLNWAIIDNVVFSLSGTYQLIGGKRCFDVHFDGSTYTPFDDYLVTGVGSTWTNMMRIRIRKA